MVEIVLIVVAVVTMGLDTQPGLGKHTELELYQTDSITTLPIAVYTWLVALQVLAAASL